MGPRPSYAVILFLAVLNVLQYHQSLVVQPSSTAGVPACTRGVNEPASADAASLAGSQLTDAAQPLNPVSSDDVPASDPMATLVPGAAWPPRHRCKANGQLILMQAWRPRFVVSHVEEIRMKWTGTIVMLCPDGSAFYDAVNLFTGAEAKQLYGDVLVYFFPHVGHRATLSNGLYQLSAAAHFVEGPLRADCQHAVTTKRTGQSAAETPSNQAFENLWKTLKVFVFDPARSILCSNPFPRIKLSKMNIIQVPTTTSHFYNYQYSLLKDVWKGKFNAIKTTYGDDQEDDSERSNATTPRKDAPDAAASSAASESEGGEYKGAELTAAPKPARYPSVDSSGLPLVVSSLGMGASASFFMPFWKSVVRALANQTMANGNELSIHALGSEPLLTNVANVDVGRHRMRPISGVVFTSNTFCPQFHSPARYCHRFASRPTFVGDYQFCTPRGPAPLTHHVAIPAHVNETFETMLQGMCHSMMPFRHVRVDVHQHDALLPLFPDGIVSTWKSWAQTTQSNNAIGEQPKPPLLPSASKLRTCPEGMRRNVVVTIATGYHADKIKWLTRTFHRYRQAGCDILVLVLDRYLTEYERISGKQNGVYIIPLPSLKANLLLKKCPMFLARIEILRNVLRDHIIPQWNPRYVLMVDARDTYFQDAPFRAMADFEQEAREEGNLLDHESEFLAMPAMPYVWGSMDIRVPQRFLINRQWATTLIPPRAFDGIRGAKFRWIPPPNNLSSANSTAASYDVNRSATTFPALCGGLYFGTALAMLDFLDLFEQTIRSSPQPCSVNDQGALVGLVPAGLGVARYPHPFLLLDPLQSKFSNEPEYGLSVRSDSRGAVTLNCRGQRYAVLHQFVPVYSGVREQLKKLMGKKREY